MDGKKPTARGRGSAFELRSKGYRMMTFFPFETTTPVAEEALMRCPARLNTALGAVVCFVIPFTFVVFSVLFSEMTSGLSID